MIKIRQVQIGKGADQVSLENDGMVAVILLTQGITFHCDKAPDPVSVKGKPVAEVSLDLPWPFSTQEIELFGGERSDVLGFRTTRLEADITAEEKQIQWYPPKGTAQWLTDGLFQYMERMKWGDRVLATLKLKGNFLWKKGNPDLYLDGDVFGTPDNGRTGVRLDEGSGDGRRGGDFEMWFWLTRAAVAERLVVETYTKHGSIFGRVTDQLGEPIPGVQLTVARTQLGILTNAEGRFQFLNVPAGTYDLRASRSGYTPMTVSVNVPSASRE